MSFQAAKWLKVQALLDGNELERLFQALMPFELFSLSTVNAPVNHFAAEYRSWIEQLQQGTIPQIPQPFKALALTSDLTIKPYIQIQPHHMHYSSVDGQFRSMTFGPNAIFWGLQFGFPQVYQDPVTQQFIDDDLGPNETVFQTLRRWIRDHTTPTPMVAQEKKTNLPIRLGKQCKTWVHKHPQLHAQGLHVA